MRALILRISSVNGEIHVEQPIMNIKNGIPGHSSNCFSAILSQITLISLFVEFFAKPNTLGINFLHDSRDFFPTSELLRHLPSSLINYVKIKF